MWPSVQIPDELEARHSLVREIIILFWFVGLMAWLSIDIVIDFIKKAVFIR